MDRKNEIIGQIIITADDLEIMYQDYKKRHSNTNALSYENGIQNNILIQRQEESK